MKYQRDHRQPIWFSVKNRAADDINQDDSTDSASHFAKCHFDIRRSSGLGPQQPNAPVTFHFTKWTCNTHMHPHTYEQQSDPVHRHKHTDSMSINTTDKTNTHRGSIHLEKRLMQTHTDVYTTDKHSDESSQTQADAYIHTDSGTHTQRQADAPRHTHT